MNRRAGFALAVIAVLAVHAVSAPAQAPRRFNDLWRAAIQTVLAKGKSESSPNSSMVTYELQDFSGDPKGAHSLHSITTVGALPAPGEYKVGGAQLYFGDRRRSESGGWTRVEWVFRTKQLGLLTEVIHKTFSTPPGDEAEQETVVKTDLSDPETKALYAKELEYWADRKP